MDGSRLGLLEHPCVEARQSNNSRRANRESWKLGLRAPLLNVSALCVVLLQARPERLEHLFTPAGRRHSVPEHSPIMDDSRAEVRNPTTDLRMLPEKHHKHTTCSSWASNACELPSFRQTLVCCRVTSRFFFRSTLSACWIHRMCSSCSVVSHGLWQRGLMCRLGHEGFHGATTCEAPGGHICDMAVLASHCLNG